MTLTVMSNLVQYWRPARDQSTADQRKLLLRPAETSFSLSSKPAAFSSGQKSSCDTWLFPKLDFHD